MARGQALIRDAWISGDFELADELDIISRHHELLTPEIDRARLDRLLLEGDLSAAQREIPRAPADAQQLAQVRVALAKNPRKGAIALSSIPQQLQNDPGLLFDWAKLLTKPRQVNSVAPVLSRTPVRELARVNAGKWWSEVNLAARTAIQDGSYATAHFLAAGSGLLPGNEYADAEFLAGWLDLRFLRNPREARMHFSNVTRTLTRPISKARGYYWAARASEAAGDYGQAGADYAQAGQYPLTFYGQLSLARQEPAPALRLRDTLAEATADERARYQSHDLTRAIHVLGDLGMVALLRTFATYDAESHLEPIHLKLLASDLARMGFTDVAIRVAKNAGYTGMHFLNYSHPLISVPAYRGPGSAPEAAFILAIIRQETEFDPAAVSGAGARGLMQLMPASAEHNAKRAGVSYRLDELITSPAYNMQLGMVEVADDLVYYGGSYLLTAAAYNAGKGNVNRWISAFGDPRSPVVDPVDWIEEIPFAETRNYVQRVLESTEVYRNRLSGGDQPLRILADLYRPRTPDTYPLPPDVQPLHSRSERPQSIGPK
ncbi:MAG: lytic transglycosylase domain-containing protein [Alphaproteobacteria bacterium]|nr:lytic transglycosylase domain-containing protein [Alphaproteobacteria bacterium]